MSKLFKLIALSCFTTTATTSAHAQCFNYSSLSGPQTFVEGFSAAACTGYFAATQESTNPDLFAQLELMMSNMADVMEEVHCGARNVIIGAEGEVSDKFKMGYDLAIANASQVQAGAMSMDEFQMRVGMCAHMVTHYASQM